MRRSACDGGVPAVTRGLWLLATLVSVTGVTGCAITGHEVQVEDAVGPETSAVEVPDTPPAVPAPPTDEWVRLRGTTVEAIGSTHRLVFDLSRIPDSVTHFRLPTPPRVVLDVHGPHIAASKVDRYAADDQLVQGVRVGHYDGRMRVVIDLKGASPEQYAVREEGSALVVYLGAFESVEAFGEQTPELSQETAAADQTGEMTGTQGPAEPAADEPPGNTELAAAAAPLDPPLAAAPAPPVETAGAALDETDLREDDPSSAPPPERTSRPTAWEPTEPRLAKLTADPKDPPRQPRRYTGKHISLDFKDADVQNVLRVIADMSALNIVATDDVKGRVTLHLVDVPWDQALDVVLDSNRLKMIREGNVIRVSTVDRVREEQEALRAQKDAERELESLQVRYVRVNYARADKELLAKVQGVLSERGSAAFDERTNTIIVRDIRRGIADATELISNLDVQSPQVLIEANIVEGVTDFARALGIQWGYRHLRGPQTGNPTGSNFPGTVDISGGGLGIGKPAAPAAGGAAQPLVPFMADFPVPSNFGPGFGPGSGSAFDLALGSLSGSDTLSARLTALEEEGKGKIISRPRVITLNNIPATIQSLTILRVKLPSTGTVVNTGTGGVAGSASTATEKIETGIILIVTPQVSSDGFVLLNIRAKSSQADFSRSVDEIPVEVSREATSNVLIRDGETVVLGGIFRNESEDRESGIPYLRRIPALGWLFKRMLNRDRKEELLVFITPQVVAGYGTELPNAGELWENRRGG